MGALVTPTHLFLMAEQMTPVEGLILDKIDTIERNLTRRLDSQDLALRDIQSQTKLTNGRVTTLEVAKERGQGMVSAFRWLPPLITAATTSGLTILTMALSGALH